MTNEQRLIERLQLIEALFAGAATPGDEQFRSTIRWGTLTIPQVKGQPQTIDFAPITLGISHELRDYEVDPNDLSALKVAAQIGLPANQVFKTLCAKGF